MLVPIPKMDGATCAALGRSSNLGVSGGARYQRLTRPPQLVLASRWLTAGIGDAYLAYVLGRRLPVAWGPGAEALVAMAKRFDAPLRLIDAINGQRMPRRRRLPTGAAQLVPWYGVWPSGGRSRVTTRLTGSAGGPARSHQRQQQQQQQSRHGLHARRE